ncbi:hypothetical protein ACIQXA_08650 [Streptomyces massasporeus]|uniref:hypothetical protein n=1 Tax=Streptomyces massasporeus TaxID=67324 RepID=UPI003823C1D5
MSITDLIPALKGHGRRRAVDEVERLRERVGDLEILLGRAGDEVALLQWDLTVAHHQLDEAQEIVVQQQATVDELTEERDHWRDEALALKARFSAQLAVDANKNRIDVPPMIRPIDGPEDQATGPIDVRPLREAAAAGLLGPVTDPGHIA